MRWKLAVRRHIAALDLGGRGLPAKRPRFAEPSAHPAGARRPVRIVVGLPHNEAVATSGLRSYAVAPEMTRLVCVVH